MDTIFNKPKMQRKHARFNNMLWRYFPPQILITLTIILTFVIVFSERISEIFITNVALNSIIIFTIIYTTIVVINNCVKMIKSARFIEEIKQYERPYDDPQPIIDDYDRFDYHRLSGHRKLLKSSYFSDALKKFCETSTVRLSMDQVENIKSITRVKLNGDKQAVQYFIGILVMLGLIGTFWGLLETIKSVGEAMNSIVDTIGGGEGDGGDGGGDQLGAFIGSIAKPLQGMGLAFSSSLFGLSGSLIVGFMNFFCVNAQRRFMEDYFNWLENRMDDPPKAGRMVAGGGAGFGGGTGGGGEAVGFDQGQLFNLTKGVLSHMDMVMRSIKEMVEQQTLNHGKFIELGDAVGGQNDLIRRMMELNQAQKEAAMQQSSHLVSIEMTQQKMLDEMVIIRQGVHSRFQETIQQRLLERFEHVGEQLHETMTAIHESHLTGIDTVKQLLSQQNDVTGHLIEHRKDQSNMLMTMQEISHRNEAMTSAQERLHQRITAIQEAETLQNSIERLNIYVEESTKMAAALREEYARIAATRPEEDEPEDGISTKLDYDPDFPPSTESEGD